ncbi:MAG: TIGR02186 family protein [Alphaproteobacteria bacterium]|nr:TIGR02186 family protein [Alphaproteobacteria bacterium]
MIRLFVVSIMLALCFNPQAWSEADGVVADISSYYVDISPSFTGTRVLLYGAVDIDNGNVILIIKGPRNDFLMDKQERVLGIWVKGKTVLYDNVPHFYHIISSEPVDKIASLSAIETYNLALDALNITGTENRLVIAEQTELRQYLRKMEQNGLYSQSTENFVWLGKRLFRVELNFPVNVPTGTYILESYHLRDGYVVSAQALPLFIRKSGFLGFLDAFADNYGYLYGLVAMIMACMMGYVAHRLFGKD